MRLICFHLLLFFIYISGCSQPDKAQNVELIDKTQSVELVGHRGATALLPENTIPGFLRALELGVDGIEMDVVISGDDQVVISHEPWFRHDICLTPEGDPIDEDAQMDHLFYNMTYEQIAQYDCGSIPNPRFPNQENQPLSKPLLREAITEIESYITENNYEPISYYIDVKSKPAWDNKLQPEPSKVAQLIYAELADLDVLDRVRILTLDIRMLHAFKDLDTSIIQAYSTSKNNPDLAANLAKLNYTPQIYGSQLYTG
jgi:glycerophosphoryl diester phosphodiesterase